MLVVELLSTYFFFFFFSSRRRHTRLQGDWSSDVCSSDVFVRRRKERYRVARDVLGEHLAVAVGDGAAGRRQRDRAQPVRLRLELVLRVLEDLRAEEQIGRASCRERV